MTDERSNVYAERLAQLIRVETVSNEQDKNKFYDFQNVLRELFPHIFAVCSFEDFNGSFLMCWKGNSAEEPVLIMNHQDVVEAPGEWTYPPFSGTIAAGKVWGRGTLDTKGGLWAMLQAADELAKEGYVPKRDFYFMSTCNEENSGVGAETISRELRNRGLHFYMVLDEGGMIVEEPMAGVKGSFAMVGVGEKGIVDLKFIARSTGGHASTPDKNTPLVRLGKFMAAAEKKKLFKAYMSPTVCEMFRRLSGSMKGILRFVFKHSRFFKPLLVKMMPSVSNTANAVLKTTVAFTMSGGSKGANVLPQEAWVVANMRFSHHQGREDSIRAIQNLAEKYGIETVVLDAGISSPLSDYKSEAFGLIEKAVHAVFTNVKTSPYVMMAASDCRYMSRVSENCLRFSPFSINQAQLKSVHGIDENVDVATLAPAVDFYRYIITEA